MADNKLALDLEVKGVEQSISSIKDLKNAIKDARNEQIKAGEQFGISSKQYEDAAKKVSALKDKVEDLGDSTKSLQGSGIERASQGFNQLGEGLRNLDFDKVKVGLTAIKSALAATGIMLVVQGFTYLVENFDELSKGSGILAKALQTVGDILNGIKEAFYGVTDAIGATNHQLDLMGDKITENVEKFKESLDVQVKGYDRQIAVMKAAGQETIDMEINKQKQIIFTNSILIKQIELYVRKGGELNDEKKKQLSDAINANKDAIAQIEILEISHTNELKKENDKRLENNKKYNDEKLRLQAEEADAWWAERLAEEAQITKEEEDAKKAEQDEYDRLARLGAAQDEQMKRFTDQSNEREKRKVEEAEKEKALRQKTLEDDLAYTKQGLQATQQLTDLFFAYKLNKHKGDAKAELEIRKKQFNVNKAFGITTAVIDGIGAVQKALNNPYPLNIVLAAISGIAAAANVAKIASTKFDGGGASSGGGGEAPTTVPIPTAPTINTPQANTNSSTTFDETGKKIGGENNTTPTIKVNATVGVNEIAEKSNRVNVLESQSKF